MFVLLNGRQSFCYDLFIIYMMWMDRWNFFLMMSERNQGSKRDEKVSFGGLGTKAHFYQN